MARASKATTSGKKPAARSSRKRARGSGAASVYEELRRDILGLNMEPGTLLDETELAERFRLSRSPVREALIRLSAEGLVQTLRNRSSIVAPFDIVAIPSYLDAVELMYRITTRLAAENRRPAQLARIAELQEEHADATRRQDALNMIRLNHEFHTTIAEASGNSFYATWTRQMLDQGQRMLRLYLHSLGDHVDNKKIISDHLAMVRAIEARDPDAAEQAARRDADIISSQMKDRFSSKPSGGMKLDGSGRSKR
jgi:DNA-binding GntR family transcriptional regulator